MKTEDMNNKFNTKEFYKFFIEEIKKLYKDDIYGFLGISEIIPEKILDELYVEKTYHRFIQTKILKEIKAKKENNKIPTSKQTLIVKRENFDNEWKNLIEENKNRPDKLLIKLSLENPEELKKHLNIVMNSKDKKKA